jgi:RNA polymerase sigma factor (sigma-70 family)
MASEVLQHLRRTVLLREGAGLTDGQLLERFISARDSAALAALVRRHGPMVWGVCRRVLRSEHDAEDAFQAAFLVLVRKPASVVPREMVANWLHGVAYQTALKARATAARRRARERQVAEIPEPLTVPQELWNDLQPLFDQELSNLPDIYRAVVVLCDLEGKTRREAARLLGCPEGTVAGRLARARALLAKRLSQRGVALSGGALTSLLLQNAAPACVPAPVVSATIETATLVATGKAATAVVLSSEVAALTEGVLKAMLLGKLKFAVALLMILAAIGASAGSMIYHARAGGPENRPAKCPKDHSHRKDQPTRDPVPAADRQPAAAAVWDLDFRFKNPRLMTAAAPQMGPKAAPFWYLWYEVRNNTKEPHTFIPDFEIVISDKVYHDGIWAGLLDAVRRVEDPTDFLKLKNSVTISAEPIPPVKARGVCGVAFWGYDQPEVHNAKNITVFVNGLSNAWSVTGDTIRRKALKISFKWVDGEMVQAGPAEWVYRSSKVKVEDRKEDPRAEIDKLIKQLTRSIDELTSQQVIWKEHRQQLQDEIRKCERLADLPQPEVNEEDRKVFVNKMLRKILEYEEQIAAGDREETARRVTLELYGSRLEDLRRLFREGQRLPEPQVEDSKSKGDNVP